MLENHTDSPIDTLARETRDIVWRLWGGFAKGKGKIISPYASINNYHILGANHPSPLSANRGGWFGCKHFSTTNTFLRKHGLGGESSL
jgi:uracil-DNA glycosylase